MTLHESSKIVTYIKEGNAVEFNNGFNSNRDPRKSLRARRLKTGVGIMLRTVSAIGAAAIVAAVFVAAPSLSPQVEARGSVPGVKADRADMRPLATNCSQNAWPYFEASCLRDTRNPFGQARDVRLVSADRLPAGSAR
jgi:hypothetical protein